MSEHIYEQRQHDAWHSYNELRDSRNDWVSFRVNYETFMARHVRVNEWLVSNMRGA